MKNQSGWIAFVLVFWLGCSGGASRGGMISEAGIDGKSSSQAARIDAPITEKEIADGAGDPGNDGVEPDPNGGWPVDPSIPMFVERDAGHGYAVRVDALSACQAVAAYTAGHAHQICVVQLCLPGAPCRLVEQRTAEAFEAMRIAALHDNVNIVIIDGYRSMDDQRYRYNEYQAGRGNMAAHPGYSRHQNGLALDVNRLGPRVYDWMVAHAHEYGFQRTVPNEPWHWERPADSQTSFRMENGATITTGACFSATLSREVTTDTCVRSAADGRNYRCVDGVWRLDEQTCGNVCGPASACPAGQICRQGQCIDCSVLPAPPECQKMDAGSDGGSDASGVDAAQCPSGQLFCLNWSTSKFQCINPANDNYNCGQCGSVCSASGYDNCCDGKCFANRWYLADPQNCGSCGNACLEGQGCVDGHCGSCRTEKDCKANKICCNGICRSDDSFIDDSSNCGYCGNVCTNGSICTGRTCCDVASGNRVICNGSCIAHKISNSNCGSCGHACGADESCRDGLCCPRAPRDYPWQRIINCNGSCVNIDTDPNNCWGCGWVCPDGTKCGSTPSALGGGDIPWCCNEQHTLCGRPTLRSR